MDLPQAAPSYFLGDPMKYQVFKVTALLIATISSAHAQSGEEIISGMNVCINHAESGAEKLSCAKRGFASADKLLNDEYRAAVRRYELNENEGAILRLRKEQRAWIVQRNEVCDANPDQAINDDGQPLGSAAFACLARESVQRAAELAEILQD